MALDKEHTEQVRVIAREEKRWLIPTIVFTYASIVFGAGIAYGQISDNSETLEKQQVQVNKIDVIRNDIEHIKRHQKEMNARQEKIIDILQNNTINLNK